MESWVSGLNQQSTKLPTSVSFLSSNLRLSAKWDYWKTIKATVVFRVKSVQVRRMGGSTPHRGAVS